MTTRVEIENPAGAVWDVLIQTEDLAAGVQRGRDRPRDWVPNPSVTVKPGNKVILFIHSGMRISKVEERRHAQPKVEQDALDALLRQARPLVINETAHGHE